MRERRSSGIHADHLVAERERDVDRVVVEHGLDSRPPHLVAMNTGVDLVAFKRLPRSRVRPASTAPFAGMCWAARWREGVRQWERQKASRAACAGSAAHSACCGLKREAKVAPRATFNDACTSSLFTFSFFHSFITSNLRTPRCVRELDVAVASRAGARADDGRGRRRNGRWRSGSASCVSSCVPGAARRSRTRQMAYLAGRERWGSYAVSGVLDTRLSGSREHLERCRVGVAVALGPLRSRRRESKPRAANGRERAASDADEARAVSARTLSASAVLRSPVPSLTKRARHRGVAAEAAGGRARARGGDGSRLCGPSLRCRRTE
eukprot:IDg22752t1